MEQSLLRRAIGWLWLEGFSFSVVAGAGLFLVSGKMAPLVDRIGVCYLGQIPQTDWLYWTGIPFCIVIFAVTIWTLWRVRPVSWLAVALLVVLIFELGVLGTPFFIYGYLHLVHNIIATTMFIIEWVIAGWLTFRVRGKMDAWMVLVWLVQSVASVLAGLTFVDLSKQMYLGQVVAQLSFVLLLIRYLSLEMVKYKKRVGGFSIFDR